MKRVLKWVGILLLVLIIGVLILGWSMNKPYPEGKPGAEADALAREMMASVNKEAWDSTKWVSWNFMDRHSFLWDKERHLVEATWGDKLVLLNPNTGNGKAWQGGKELAGEELEKVVQSALAFFFNDSFWLNAVVKPFDPGTERMIVELENGDKGLLVKYSSGGVTPGDSYLWILDEKHRPKSWQMWVSVLPIGGVETSWEKWDTLPTGALIATWHGGSFGEKVGVRISNLKGGMNLADVGREEDPFKNL